MAHILDVENLHLHSDFWVNLHHVLYACAWAARSPSARPGAQPLPAAVDLPASAVQWYEVNLADKNLLFSDGMSTLHWALARGDLDALDARHREVLVTAAAGYRENTWPAHDARNRAWAAGAAGLLADLAEDVVPMLQQWFAMPWPAEPVRVDVVWVCHWAGAYTVLDPAPHVIGSSTNERHQGLASAEILVHEVSHLLASPLHRDLDGTGNLWHGVLFYLCGEAVRRAFARRGVDYTPYLFSTGLIDRAWPQQRQLLTTTWRAFADGEIGRDDAIRISRAADGDRPAGAGG